jgi:hypothetical protein
MGHTADAQIESQAVPCKIGAGQSGNWTGFCLSTLCVPCVPVGPVGESWDPSNRAVFYGDLRISDSKVLPCCLVNDSVNYAILNL